MIKRLSIFATATAADGTRYANVPAGQNYVCVAELTPNRWLCKQTLPDGTATTAGWLVDVTVDADGNQTDVDVAALILAQFSAAKTWLTNQGIDTTGLTYTVVKDRRALLVWLLKRIAWWAGYDLAQMRDLLLRGYEVA